jgi:hypothetical protein
MSREVEVPDDLWKRFNEPASDAEAAAAQEELSEFMTKNGIRLNAEDLEKVEDEWYDDVKDVCEHGYVSGCRGCDPDKS